MPLPANWVTGNSFTASAENAVETAVNGLGAGTTIIPKRVSSSGAATLTLTTAYNVYVFTGTSSTWTMPAVAGNTGHSFIIYNRGSGLITLNRAGSDTLRYHGADATSIPIANGGSVEFVNDGTQWLGSDKYTPAPAYDGSAKSGYKSALNSPVSFNWTQVVNTTSYGIVAIFNACVGLNDFNPATTTKNVTFGGVTLGYLGVIGDWGWNDREIVWVFGGPGITAGTKTVSVGLTQAGKNFYGHAMSFTYSNVRGVGALQGTFGDGDINYIHLLDAVPADPGPTVMWQALTSSGTGDMPTTSISNVRQVLNQSQATPKCAVGDMSVITLNHVQAMFPESAYAGSAVYGTCTGLSLY